MIKKISAIHPAAKARGVLAKIDKFIEKEDFYILKETWQLYIDYLSKIRNTDPKFKIKNKVSNF
jgi:hypothetical protein